MRNGISYGQQMDAAEYLAWKTTRKSLRDSLDWLKGRDLLTPSQVSKLKLVRDDSLVKLEPYSKQACGYQNNVLFIVAKPIPNGHEVSRAFLAWVPDIFKKEAMLPSLYAVADEWRAHDEFVFDIQFL